MKDSMDSTAAKRAPETPAQQQSEDFANRKLIRPTLARPDHASGERRERPTGPRRAPSSDQTHAENFYYQKQMQTRTHLVVVTKDGEHLHGTLEWYDRDSVKLNRAGASNLLIYKRAIKYIYKDEANGRK